MKNWVTSLHGELELNWITIFLNGDLTATHCFLRLIHSYAQRIKPVWNYTRFTWYCKYYCTWISLQLSYLIVAFTRDSWLHPIISLSKLKCNILSVLQNYIQTMHTSRDQSGENNFATRTKIYPNRLSKYMKVNISYR